MSINDENEFFSRLKDMFTITTWVNTGETVDEYAKNLRMNKKYEDITGTTMVPPDKVGGDFIGKDPHYMYGRQVRPLFAYEADRIIKSNVKVVNAVNRNTAYLKELMEIEGIKK